MEAKTEPIDPFRNKSKKYIKDLVYYDDEVPDTNIGFLKRQIGDTKKISHQNGNSSSSGHEDQDLGGRAKETSSRKRIRKALYFVNAKKTKVNALDDSPLSHPDNADDGPSNPLPDEVVDASCKTLPLIDLAHVHNDDGPSSPLSDQVEDASCKTLPSSPLPIQVDDFSCKTLRGEVDDSAVDSEDRSPDERITDVLAQIHGKDDIEEFGDAAQNDYETANEEVV
ncbi:hypothetical protein K7X08_003380 [Anisodus acutangulus]|uniref:Uncharacterized protein n=1 Tax=Anisodus acutangulus TaxID=402998 RepID=A0A9Q1MKH8_9SOLA|nr:hypothetical protein K7X08_003380 [Anisodus acutangulus]